MLPAILQIWFASPLDGSELSGGRLTGPILGLSVYGGYLFLLASILAFVVPRVSSIATFAAGLLCLPLYVYFIAPGIFRRLFHGEHKIVMTSTFMWSPLAVAGVCAIALSFFIAGSSLKKNR